MLHSPSPNFDERYGENKPDMLLMHYTGMETAEEALARLCDPEAKVSAHYMIDVDGTVSRLVDEGKRAWHAGLAHWQGETDINSAAIGIEIQNPGHEFGYVPFPARQMKSLVKLSSDIIKRHDIQAHRVLGHSDVAPARKEDPGELFPWQRLAGEGIGIWPKQKSGAALGDKTELRKLLTQLGYDPEAPLLKVVTAFQRHWQPNKIDGVANKKTWGCLRALL